MSMFPDDLEPWQVAALERYNRSVTGEDLFPAPVVDVDEDEEPDEA